ncbi:hypothetical protein TVAGG3_0723020 [Trichomonas vaginalis G3]|uniref:hypothetical protein n=1 Tax=Trichomonas vaginalis (strain ATCC PRA-98 / G3) TaxID=412133 RepID=UPI0021E52D22|nr:hypothetical protein TVAGG3_0723020 [Trichomonas vaginalis G3]KAI5510715.1 hypothetical protein TVAGG3_0723020 [Trichomonas vaginalis G3]
MLPLFSKIYTVQSISVPLFHSSASSVIRSPLSRCFLSSIKVLCSLHPRCFLSHQSTSSLHQDASLLIKCSFNKCFLSSSIMSSFIKHSYFHQHTLSSSKASSLLSKVFSLDQGLHQLPLLHQGASSHTTNTSSLDQECFSLFSSNSSLHQGASSLSFSFTRLPLTFPLFTRVLPTLLQSWLLSLRFL